MRRRAFASLLTALAIGWPVVGRTQSPDHLKRIGMLMGGSPTFVDARLRVSAFVQALQQLGWSDGRNLRIDYRWTEGDADRRREDAAELVRLEPDVIATVGTPELAAAVRETRTIPIVFMSVSDPVGLGFVASLAHPGGNVTGFANYDAAMGSKWLELLKEMAPGVTRVALLFNPETAPINEPILRSLQAAAPSLAVQVTAAPVHEPAELERTMAVVSREPGGGLIVGPDNFTSVHSERITTLAAMLRLPAIYPLRLFAGSGGLLVYGIDLIEQARQAAAYVDRILRGEKPGSLPVQRPTKFELVVNRRTAEGLGLTIPPSILARADEVIE